LNSQLSQKHYMEIHNGNTMNVLYDHNGYFAWEDRNGVVVIHRILEATINNSRLCSHVGEKHPSQDWREVTLHGCPIEIKREIAKAHLTKTKFAPV
jgi:hypothetical protein